MGACFYRKFCNSEATQEVSVVILGGHSKGILVKLAIVCPESRALSTQLPCIVCAHSRSLHLRQLPQMVMIRPNTMAKVCEAGGSTFETKIARC